MFLQSGSLRLFRLFNVNVYVHWLWALGFVYQLYRARNSGFSYPFLIAQYLCLFAIVLIHEFGHALACKSVGGKAERIVLWPLGGLAFVQPPPRPGALLWSIAAGPLVNVVLLPITIVPPVLLGYFSGNTSTAVEFLGQLALINLILLLFNMLPIYPLDGGQILRALIWFVTGRGISLIIAASIGIAGAGVLALSALFLGQTWLAFLVAFMGFQAINAIKQGLAIHRLESTPRHPDAECPDCHQHPPAAPAWGCPCGARFDTFQTHAQCPNCNTRFGTTRCPFCHQSAPVSQWFPPLTVTTVPAPQNNP